MTARRWIVSGCFLAALAVLVGAFAAHQSKRQDDPAMPVLSKIPFIAGLFHNHASVPATDGLMKMVTPPLMIQDEEEAKLLGTQP